MNAEAVARWSAWPAFLCYAAALAIGFLSREPRRMGLARGLWTVGWLALVVHVSVAMLLVHHGSWQAAYEHTAERTLAATGWNSGSGVWFNLVTVFVWGFFVLWMWLRPHAVERRPRWLEWTVHFYVAFMMINATLVFGSPAAQIAAGLFCVGLAAGALLMLRRAC